jgi:hypothetical protein
VSLAKTASPAKKKAPIEIIVKRGAMRRFDALKTRTSTMPVVVTWDRRTTDRRRKPAEAEATQERRGADRRKTPPFTWDLAGFVVVEPTKRQKTSRKRPAKKP